MEKRKIVCLPFLLVIAISVFSGCGSKEFDKNYDNFISSYLKVTEVLDVKDPFTSIEKLNQEPMLKELQIMKDVVDQIGQEASSESEKRIYDNVVKYYSGLEYLQYSAKNKKELTEEARGKLDSELTSALMRRNSIIRGDI